MKVILNSDIEGKGEVGDIVEVKSGYARNFLFPKQWAIPVTQHNLNLMKAKKKKIDKKLEIERLSAQEQVKKLEELTLTFEKKAGENDVLFGSVTTSDIENQLAELGVTIERKKIHLEEQIKRLGNYSCKIKLMKDVEAEIKIIVVGEEGLKPEKPPKEEETEPLAKEEKPGDEEDKEDNKPEQPEKKITEEAVDKKIQKNEEKSGEEQSADNQDETVSEEEKLQDNSSSD
jgi:large subunit ribosomal protein L9